MPDRQFIGESVESVIRDAAKYVKPSRDLRPRTIEAARTHCQDIRAEQKLGALVLAVMLLLFVSTPMLHFVDLLRARGQMPTANDVEQLAIEYSDRREIGSNFGLSEAFTELRRFQASRLGQSVRDLR